MLNLTIARPWAAALAASLALCLSFSAWAQTPQPPEIAARSYLLLDVTSNQVLAAKAADTPVEPASLTKLMTAYLVFDALKTKKIALDQNSLSASAPGRCPALACSSIPKCRCPLKICSKA